MRQLERGDTVLMGKCQGELHVYSPESHHEDAFIIGDRKAIKSLKLMIEIALKTSPTNKASGAIESCFFVSDGEGFTLNLIMLDKLPSNLALPYTADHAKSSEDKIHPFDVKRTNHTAILEKK